MYICRECIYVFPTKDLIAAASAVSGILSILGKMAFQQPDIMSPVRHKYHLSPTYASP
jgi:hypothetical protein